jgi:hypothetical protein
MIGWFDAHAGLAIWLIALGLAAAAVAGFVQTRRLRLRRERALICSALHPIRSLAEATRVLREMMEQGDKARLVDVDLLADGTLAQRLRDVRGLPVQSLPGSRSIEAVYEAREAAARLMVWLERGQVVSTERRLAVQLIWKTLHDAAGNLERDLAQLDSPSGADRRRF